MSFQVSSSSEFPQQKSGRPNQISSTNTTSSDYHSNSSAAANVSGLNTSRATTSWSTSQAVPAQKDGMNLKLAGAMRICCCAFGTWVWVCFYTCAVFATIFSILCALVYQDFVNFIFKLRSTNGLQELAFRTSPSSALVTGLPYRDWQALLWGTAVSAVFAFVICFTFHVGTLLMLLCSLKSLGHPGRRFGRGFVVAASLWTALHILNISLQFHSFGPMMNSLTLGSPNNKTGHNPFLLNACTSIGYLTSSLYMLYCVLVLCWRQETSLLQVGVPSSSSAFVAV
ncbi:hypothetical protein CEUSTIGMA_g9082.t1 [Chlamydomonas eustigma]|uniref:Uncharacterized protein n=1 Tax=Chlamydomonas eustigma TaxID=1157962 RepID=A0A250XEY7_9CHLO|nr:hypothetical protein CEUSTIGMA_g9082.t1 [Chlamydomonas eustigma]|eukprot:GAX81654.1 hypothetical protein CEUSTIGMA_g9082.t1 [Chlamydomonas eustigma]